MMQILTFLVTTTLQQPGTLRENILVEFFVAKDHLRDGVLFLVDANQALTTDKGVHVDRRRSVLFSTKLMM